MEKKTKIVATIGPASDSVTKIKSLIESGVNVFRFNMKHADVAWHRENILKVRGVARSMKERIGILVDLQGPEIRISTFDHEDIKMKKGESIFFTDSAPSRGVVFVPNGFPVASLVPGDPLMIDDGLNEFIITRKTQTGVYAKAVDDCVIQDHKGLNLPGKHINLPSLTRDDLLRLDMSAELDVDFVALSFCRSKKDLDKLKSEMEKRKLQAKVVSKVESREALNNIDEIIANSDVVMVARGDLGVEVPFEELAYWQKVIIDKCRIKSTTVIVATQMLESMKASPRPTRAEVTDVANAVLQGTDAIMLSGETASGKFPLKAVQAMEKIAKFNEGRANSVERVLSTEEDTELVVSAASSMIKNNHGPQVDAIIVFTDTGFTARVISSYRPTMPIIAVTEKENAIGELTLSYGVIPVYEKFPEGLFKMPTEMFVRLVKKRLIKKGSTVLVIHGEHWKRPGRTNALALHRV